MSDRWIPIDPVGVRVSVKPEHRPILVQWACLFAFLGLAAPTVISYASYGLSWDPAYYLHNAVCMNHAVYDFSWSRVAECLSNTSKGPIMDLFTLPWGRTGGTFWGIGLAFVGLALFIWILLLITYLTCVRARVPPTSLLIAGASICLTPFLRLNGGAMMTDTLLGWSIALGLMLIPLEYSDPQISFWPSIVRGLLWALVINVGLLSKVTFVFFLGTIGVALLVIRWQRSGKRPLFYSLIGCLVGSAPALLIWLTYGKNFLHFAVRAALSLAQLYSIPGMTSVGYLRRYFGDLGFALAPLSVLIILFVRGLFIEEEGRLVRVLPLGIVLMYLVTASVSQNRDPRFSIPVMIAMPIALSWTTLRRASEPMQAMPIVAALLVGMLFVIPMVGKPDIAPIESIEQLLRSLSQGRPMDIMVATEGGYFNIDTVELARQIGGEYLRAVRVDTVAYDEINNRTLEDGLRRISKSDYVLFLKPGNSPSPDWTRTHAEDYRAYCEKIGSLMNAQTSPDFDVYKMH
jgi:hypothetical protein